MFFFAVFEGTLFKKTATLRRDVQTRFLFSHHNSLLSTRQKTLTSLQKHPELKQDAKTDTYGVEAAYYHMRQQAGKADAKGGDGDAAYDSFGMHAAERSIMDAGGGGGLRSDLKTIMASMNPSMSDQQRAMSFGAVRDSGHGGIFANYQSPIAPGMYSTGGDHTGTAAGNRFGCSRFGGPDQSSFMM